MRRLTEGYARALEAALARPYLVLGLAGLAFLSVFPILPRIPFNFTPARTPGCSPPPSSSPRTRPSPSPTGRRGP